MKRILNILTATLIAFTFAACEQLQENGNGNGGNDNSQTSELKFTLTKGAITGTDAKITVSHNGKSTDSWYWICVEKTDDIDGAISDVLDNNKYQRSHHKAFNDFDVLIDELQASTEYTFIVFGLSSDMKVYGTVASLDFKTRFAEMTANPNWTVRYTGPYTDPETDEVMAEHTITVESTDNQKYFVAAFKKDAVEFYNDLTYLAEYELSYIYYTMGEGETLDNYTYTASQTIGYPMEPGDWYAYAFGINDNGELTGIYAQSELYTIKEEDPTPEYQSWIGDWTFTGANDVAFDVTIAKDINNMYLTMYGWEGYSDPDAGIGITLYWDKIENDWLIQNEYYYEDDWGGDVGPGMLGLFGCDEEFIYLFDMSLPICYSETDEDGTKTCKGATLTAEGDGSSINMLYMQYAIYPYDENASIGVISDVTEWPEFPITITPRTSGGTGNPETQIKAASVQNKLKFNKKAINAGKDFKNTRKSFDRMAVR